VARLHAGYSVVEGLMGTPEALATLRPSVLVPLDNDNVDNTGVLGAIVRRSGTVDPAEVKAWLEGKGLHSVAVAGPQAPGKDLDIVL
jgi:hypothetical protein